MVNMSVYHFKPPNLDSMGNDEFVFCLVSEAVTFISPDRNSSNSSCSGSGP